MVDFKQVKLIYHHGILKVHTSILTLFLLKSLLHLIIICFPIYNYDIALNIVNGLASKLWMDLPICFLSPQECNKTCLCQYIYYFYQVATIISFWILVILETLLLYSLLLFKAFCFLQWITYFESISILFFCFIILLNICLQCDFIFVYLRHFNELDDFIMTFLPFLHILFCLFTFFT